MLRGTNGAATPRDNNHKCAFAPRAINQITAGELKQRRQNRQHRHRRDWCDLCVRPKRERSNSFVYARWRPDCGATIKLACLFLWTGSPLSRGRKSESGLVNIGLVIVALSERESAITMMSTELRGLDKQKAAGAATSCSWEWDCRNACN